MKRLEYERPVRTAPGHARNSAEAVMYLAAAARERHRLGQEQRSLVKRMQRIEARLSAIAVTETKLVPMIQMPAVQAQAQVQAHPRPAAPRNAGMTLHY